MKKIAAFIILLFLMFLLFTIDAKSNVDLTIPRVENQCMGSCWWSNKRISRINDRFFANFGW